MIIVMSRRAAEADIAGVVAFIRSRGLREHISHGDERTVIGAIGDDRVLSVREVQTLPEVEKAVRILDTWKTVSRENRAEDSRVAAKGVAFGGGETVCIAAEPSVSPQNRQYGAMRMQCFWIRFSLRQTYTTLQVRMKGEDGADGWRNRPHRRMAQGNPYWCASATSAMSKRL